MNQIDLSGKRLLVQADNWFYAPDGQSYKAAWGRCVVTKAEKVLGISPSKSTNWLLQIGYDEHTALFIAGCQIHYVHICEERPIGTHVYIPDEEDRRK